MVTSTAATRLFSQAQASYVVDPVEREATYKDNIARYLLDLHRSKAVFDFCGGMMFQLELTPALEEHLQGVVATTGINDQQPVLHGSNKLRMHQLNGYQQSSLADNIRYFQGREIRNVPHAQGNMGMVLQLSLAPTGDTQERIDPQGWSVQEMQTYDGWGSDRGRVWRNGAVYEAEGFESFRETYGPKAFGLNHRFYLHKDFEGKMWLSAEDGCEGTPAKSTLTSNPLPSIFKHLL